VQADRDAGDLLLAGEQPADLALGRHPVVVAVAAQVEPGAEGPPGAGQDDGAEALTGLDLVEHRQEVEHHRVVQGVQRLRASQGDLQDSVVSGRQFNGGHPPSSSASQPPRCGRRASY
jgi:hypothetical protein